MYLRDYTIMQTGRHDFDDAVYQIAHSENDWCGPLDDCTKINIVQPMTKEEIEALHRDMEDDFLINLIIE